jgi:hypothetical protein
MRSSSSGAMVDDFITRSEFFSSLGQFEERLNQRMDVQFGRFANQLDEKLHAMDGRFPSLDGKFNALDGKFDALTKRSTRVWAACTRV